METQTTHRKMAAYASPLARILESLSFPLLFRPYMTKENIDDSEQVNFLSSLRTTIILAARKSPSSDIDIAAIDQIVESTIDFVKNLLEQMAVDPQDSSLSSLDLFNTLRVRLISLDPFQLNGQFSFAAQPTFDSQSNSFLCDDGSHKSSLISFRSKLIPSSHNQNKKNTND